jgi:hypothetical protein
MGFFTFGCFYIHTPNTGKPQPMNFYMHNDYHMQLQSTRKTERASDATKE